MKVLCSAFAAFIVMFALYGLETNIQVRTNKEGA